MRLVQTYGQEETGHSETGSILPKPLTVLQSIEQKASLEARDAENEEFEEVDNNQNLDADEHQNLVNQIICRICLDIGGDDLVAPCQCRGTQKYVHRSCLDHWRSSKEGFAFAHCTECKAAFILRANVPSDRWWLKLKFHCLVALDYAFIYVIVQLVAAFLGIMIYQFYGEELREMFGYKDHPFGFYCLAVISIFLVGLLYGFFLAIICGGRISERHYHVLAKQELTKEYAVVDREGGQGPPELDPSHIIELRALGLF